MFVVHFDSAATFQALGQRMWLVSAMWARVALDPATLQMGVFLSFGFLICTMEIISISMGYSKDQNIKCMWRYFVNYLQIMMSTYKSWNSCSCSRDAAKSTFLLVNLRKNEINEGINNESMKRCRSNYNFYPTFKLFCCSTFCSVWWSTTKQK